jgi:hypothetical protein
MDRLLIWAGFSVVLVMLCLARPNLGRITIGLFFLAMAVGANVVTTLTNPTSYAAWVDTIWLPFYRDLYATWVTPHPALFVLPIAAYEIAVAALLLYKGTAVKLGVVGAIAFLAGIMPLGIEELGNVVLVVGLATLLRHEFPATFLDYVGAHLHRHQPAAAHY